MGTTILLGQNFSRFLFRDKDEKGESAEKVIRKARQPKQGINRSESGP